MKGNKIDLSIPDAVKFLQYDYQETKELLKSFLTLTSATLVLSVTFSEKIVRTHKADKLVRSLMFSSWSLFFLGLVLGGTSILFIAGAAGCALYGVIPLVACGGWTLALISWSTGLIAGIFYALGVLCLALAARRSIILEN